MATIPMVLVFCNEKGEQIKSGIRVNGAQMDSNGQVTIKNAGEEGAEIDLDIEFEGGETQKMHTRVTEVKKIMVKSTGTGQTPTPRARRGSRPAPQGGRSVPELGKGAKITLIALVLLIALLGFSTLGYVLWPDSSGKGTAVNPDPAQATVAVAQENPNPVAVKTKVPKAETHPKAPPVPSSQEVVDPGRAPFKGPTQWSLIINGIALLIGGLFVDSWQKLRRKGKHPAWVVWVSLFATVLAICYVLFPNNAIIRVLTPTGEPIVALLICIFLTAIAAFATFDLSYPAVVLGISAMMLLIRSDKTSVFGKVFDVPVSSGMYNLEATFRLISNNQWANAGFSVLIYSSIILALLLLLVDMVKTIAISRPRTGAPVIIGLVIGVASYFIHDLAWSVTAMAVGIGLSAVLNPDDWDEVLCFALLLHTGLQLAFAVPLV